MCTHAAARKAIEYKELSGGDGQEDVAIRRDLHLRNTLRQGNVKVSIRRENLPGTVLEEFNTTTLLFAGKLSMFPFICVFLSASAQ